MMMSPVNRFHLCMCMCMTKLPWTAATRSRDKAAVIESKREFFEDPSKMVSWIVNYMNEANEKVKHLNIIKYKYGMYVLSDMTYYRLVGRSILNCHCHRNRKREFFNSSTT